MILNFYESLYSNSQIGDAFCIKGAFLSRGSYPTVACAFGRSRREVFVMGSLKAPCIDGLQPIFHESQWEMIGYDLFLLVQMVFQ
jgi:hypothetical protein